MMQVAVLPFKEEERQQLVEQEEHERLLRDAERAKRRLQEINRKVAWLDTVYRERLQGNRG